MEEQDERLTMKHLAELVDVPVRTIRFYIAQGLIPGPEGRGKGTTYGDEHLLKLRLVRRLAEQRVPLADIRRQVAGLTADEVEALLEDQERIETDLAQAMQEASPKAYVAALLDRARAQRQSPALRTMASSAQPAQVLFDAPPPKVNEAWRRCELAPGVELHVRQDAEVTSKSLVDAVLRLAAKRSGKER